MILNEFAILGHQNRAIKYSKKRSKSACNVIKIFQIQSTYSEKAGGCRPLIYDNAVSRYFSKMVFAEYLGKFSVLALLSLFKKVTEISSKTVQKVTMVPKTVHFLKVLTIPIAVLKK